jgi:hypothetical protein
VWIDFAEGVIGMTKEQALLYFDNFFLFQHQVEQETTHPAVFNLYQTMGDKQVQEELLLRTFIHPCDSPTVKSFSFILYLVQQMCLSEIIDSFPHRAVKPFSYVDYGKVEQRFELGTVN